MSPHEDRREVLRFLNALYTGLMRDRTFRCVHCQKSHPRPRYDITQHREYCPTCGAEQAMA